MSTKKLQIIGSLGGDSAKLDDTLTKEGFAADAKAVGDALAQKQPAGNYLTEHQDISGKLDTNKLPQAINEALAQAKASGEFDGKDGQDGYTPQKGVDYFDGKDGRDGVDGKTPVKGIDYFDGEDGKTPIKGTDYFTESDKLEIAELASTLVDVPDVDLTGYATEEFVKTKIAEASLEGEDVDLSGYALKSEVPTKVSQLQNDKGYLVEVPDGYAKTSDIPTKPEDINAQPAGDYALKTDMPTVPVKSVNGKTGDVNLKAADVGALPDTTKIPVKISELTNDSGFITGYTETDPTVPAWAKEPNKPTYSKSEVGLDNVDNVRQYSTNNPPPYPVTSVNGKTGAVTLNADSVGARPSTWMPTHSDVGADKSGTANTAIGTHNTNVDAHNDIRLELKAINDRLNAFFDSDDKTLDELSEIVEYITTNKALIDAVTTSKVSVADIINNLATNVANKPLSAAQGVVLKALIDAIVVPTKVSELTNDSGFISSIPSEYVTESEMQNYAQPKGDYLTEVPDGYAKTSDIPTKPEDIGAQPKGNYLTSIPSEYITESELEAKKYLTSFTETDPTVPSWAKAANKPTYTKSEVGLGNVDNVKQYSASNPPPYPVTSVNGQTGDIAINIPIVPSIDATLSVKGCAADAKAVGDSIDNLNSLMSKEINQKSQVQIITWEDDD